MSFSTEPQRTVKHNLHISTHYIG